MNLAEFDVVIVGSGFFGATIAERSAREAGLKVCILERRSHVGGNAYSVVDPRTGIEYHKYGSHLFHTNSDTVWKYLSQFTEFTNYRHRVFTVYNGQVYSMPINLGTICAFFSRHFTPQQARELINEQAAAENTALPTSLEDKAISLIGRPLYEAFIRGYTTKQWQTNPRLLPPDIITRLAVRFTFNDSYFSDRFEGLPLDGYTAIFEKMLKHDNICIHLGIDYFDIMPQLRHDQLLVYTGPIDRFFGYQLGELNWRTLDFELEVVGIGDFQGTSVMNYADESVPYTRIHEYRHLHPERKYADNVSLIAREYSRFAGRNDEPYYPVNTMRDKAIYDSYTELARPLRNVVFGGRLGTYRYLDMHQAIGAALKAFEAQVVPFFSRAPGPAP